MSPELFFRKVILRSDLFEGDFSRSIETVRNELVRVARIRRGLSTISRIRTKKKNKDQYLLNRLLLPLLRLPKSKLLDLYFLLFENTDLLLRFLDNFSFNVFGFCCVVGWIREKVSLSLSDHDRSSKSCSES